MAHYQNSATIYLYNRTHGERGVLEAKTWRGVISAGAPCICPEASLLWPAPVSSKRNTPANICNCRHFQASQDAKLAIFDQSPCFSPCYQGVPALGERFHRTASATRKSTQIDMISCAAG
jgi:hypothetical protein